MGVKTEPIGSKEIEYRLLAFEEHFGMPSGEFVEAFRNGSSTRLPSSTNGPR